MSKYNPVGVYLKNCKKEIVKLSFKDIESILGFKLAKYLRKYEAAWYGTAEGSPRHVFKKVWQEAGYIVKSVDLVNEYVIFRNKFDKKILKEIEKDVICY